jgi:hypothetical protein
MRIALTCLAAAMLAGCDGPQPEIGVKMPEPIVIPGEGMSCSAGEVAMAERFAELEARNLRLEKLVEALRAR